LDLTNELRLDEAKRGGANALVEWEEVALHELLALTDFDLERQHPAYGTHVFARLEFRRRKRFAKPITLRTRWGRRR